MVESTPVTKGEKIKEEWGDAVYKDLTDLFNASSPLVVLGKGETLTIWRGTAPEGTTLSINTGSLTNDAGNCPSGCTIELGNVTDGTSTTLIASTYTKSPVNNNIDVGGDDIQIFIANGSGSTVKLSGSINARLD